MIDEPHADTDTPDTAGEAGRPPDRVYEAIRSQILSGTLSPGSHLGEEQLALLTNSSRTPVREALRRLVSEGLVITGQNRRSYVAEFDPKEADAVFEIRARLEAYSASMAAKRITEAQIDRLCALSDQIEALGPIVSRDSLSKFLRLNEAFHQTILAAAGSRQLSLAVGAAILIPLPLLKHYIWDAQVDIVRSNLQHRELIEALRQRNSRWAGECMASHINSTRPQNGPIT